MFGLFNFGGGVFEANYRCYPVSFLDKLDAENGDKIFLPPSALDRLGVHGGVLRPQHGVAKTRLFSVHVIVLLNLAVSM